MAWSTTAPQITDRASHSAVAPAWHTAVVLCILLGFSLMGGITGNLPGIGAKGRAGGYLVVMAMEWSVVVFIRLGLGQRGLSVSDLIGGSWTSPLAVLRDLGIAVVYVLLCGFGLVNGLGYLLKAVPAAGMTNLLPRTGMESILYLLLALTAGSCEEFIFRGYLARQFSALTQSRGGGIVLQGIVFGAAHGYQGWKFMVIIAVYGSLFGMLAQWRRSLRPGMVGHFLQDGVGGILASYLMRLR